MNLDVPTIIMWLLIGGAVISVLFFGFSFLKDTKRSKRINAVINRERRDLSKQQMESLNKPSAARMLKGKKKGYMEALSKLYAGLNLHNEDVRSSLMQAGYRGKSALMVYYTCRILGVFIGFGLTYFLIIYTWKTFPYPDFVKLIFAGGGAFVGFNMPKIMVTNGAQNRQTAMNKVFPDTLDLMVICVEAGLSVEAAFARVTEEIMEQSPVLAQELGLTTAELAYLGDRRKAFTNFTARTGLPAVKSLATTLIQSEQYGTPVGAALRVLSEEKRTERMSTAEKKAASLPAKLTVPMIIFFLPVLFSVVIGPAAIRISNL